MGADAEVVGDGEAGEEVTFGSVVSLVVGGAGRPGGDVARGVRDEEVTEAAAKAGVTLYLTGARHFAH